MGTLVYTLAADILKSNARGNQYFTYSISVIIIVVDCVKYFANNNSHGAMVVYIFIEDKDFI